MTTATDGAAILRAILDEPGDDVHRLVYADWLGESGDADRAEFVRLQIARERDGGFHGFLCLPERPCGNCRREKELFAAAADSALHAGEPLWGGWYPSLMSGWLPNTLHFGEPLSEPPALLFEFRRGFVESVRCDLDAWHAHGSQIVRTHPITRVELTDKSPVEPGGDVNPVRCMYSWRRGFDDVDQVTSEELPIDFWEFLEKYVRRASRISLASDPSYRHYRTEPAAAGALSAALILWAKADGH